MAPEIMKGLKDVYLDTTKSSFIDGSVGKLLYRGYSIHDLAEHSHLKKLFTCCLTGSCRRNRNCPTLTARSAPTDASRTR